MLLKRLDFMRGFKSKIFSFATAAAVLLNSVVFARAEGAGPNLIRDAEIEGLMRLYSKPIFKADRKSVV